MGNSTEDSVFKNLNVDDIDHTVTEIESCCMNCFKNVSFYLGIFNALFNFFKINLLGHYSNATYKNSIL